jgi:hypothetical protein
LAGHRSLHVLRDFDVLDLDGGDLDSPGFCLLVDDALQVLVEALSLARRVSRSALPRTDRSVVWEICEVASRYRSTATMAWLAEMTWK